MVRAKLKAVSDEAVRFLNAPRAHAKGYAKRLASIVKTKPKTPLAEDRTAEDNLFAQEFPGEVCLFDTMTTEEAKAFNADMDEIVSKHTGNAQHPKGKSVTVADLTDRIERKVGKGEPDSN